MKKNKEKLAGFQRIARVMTHDLKNSVTNIDLSIRQIEEELTQEDIREYIKIIKRNNKKINSYLNQLLEATTFELLNRQPVTLPKLLDELLMNLSADIRQQKIDVIKDYADHLSERQLSLDKEKIKLALSHILQNAIEAMKGYKAHLTVTTHLSNRDVIITISDTGIGMDQALKTKVFEPYFSTKKQKQAGLGLTTAQKIILNHQGSLHVESTPGEGSTITIRLPCETD